MNILRDIHWRRWWSGYGTASVAMIQVTYSSSKSYVFCWAQCVGLEPTFFWVGRGTAIDLTVGAPMSPEHSIYSLNHHTHFYRCKLDSGNTLLVAIDDVTLLVVITMGDDFCLFKCGQRP